MFSGRPCGAECLSVGWCVANSQFTEPLRYRHLLLFPRNLLPCLLLISYYLSLSFSVLCSLCFFLPLRLCLPPPQVLWRTGAKIISHSQRAKILCVWCLCHMSERGPMTGLSHAFAVVTWNWEEEREEEELIDWRICHFSPSSAFWFANICSVS